MFKCPHPPGLADSAGPCICLNVAAGTLMRRTTPRVAAAAPASAASSTLPTVVLCASIGRCVFRVEPIRMLCVPC